MNLCFKKAKSNFNDVLKQKIKSILHYLLNDPRMWCWYVLLKDTTWLRWGKNQWVIFIVDALLMCFARNVSKVAKVVESTRLFFK